MHERLEQLIREKLACDISDVDIVEVGGGTNKCFSVSRADRQYFIRLPETSTSACGMRRDIEAAVIKALSAIGVCPETLYFSDVDGAMITVKIDGRKLSQGEFSSRATIRAVVQTLKKIHNLTTVPYTFYPYQHIRDRVDMSRRRNSPLPPYLDNLMDKLAAIEKKDRATHRAVPGLCHNDLIVENFIFSDAVRILDWEFAGMGDIFYDLATMSMYFPKRKRRYVLKCYFGQSPPQHEDHLNDMIFVACLWNAMWAVMMEAEGENGAYYRRLANGFFESIRERGLLESCLSKIQIPRVLRKIRRILSPSSH